MINFCVVPKSYLLFFVMKWKMIKCPQCRMRHKVLQETQANTIPKVLKTSSHRKRSTRQRKANRKQETATIRPPKSVNRRDSTHCQHSDHKNTKVSYYGRRKFVSNSPHRPVEQEHTLLTNISTPVIHFPVNIVSRFWPFAGVCCKSGVFLDEFWKYRFQVKSYLMFKSFVRYFQKIIKNKT